MSFEVTVQLDAVAPEAARVQACRHILPRLQPHGPPEAEGTKVVRVLPECTEVREIELSLEETERRKRIDEIVKQYSGPTFVEGGRTYRWIWKNGCQYVDVESGEEWVQADGSVMRKDVYEEWRESEIAHRDFEIARLIERDHGHG